MRASCRYPGTRVAHVDVERHSSVILRRVDGRVLEENVGDRQRYLTVRDVATGQSGWVRLQPVLILGPLSRTPRTAMILQPYLNRAARTERAMTGVEVVGAQSVRLSHAVRHRSFQAQIGHLQFSILLESAGVGIVWKHDPGVQIETCICC